MGREEMNRQVVMSDARQAITQAREMVLGPALSFTSHKKQCPKCFSEGVPEAVPLWSNRFCPGKIMMLPDQVEQPCQLPGEHLHRTCSSCGFEFRSACADEPVPITKA